MGEDRLGWIGSVAVEADGGLAWLEEGAIADNLYSGTAGVLLGCAEVVDAGLSAGRVATGARDRLLHLARQGDTPTLEDDSLFTGWAGVAVALRAWARSTDDPRAAATAATVTARIAERSLAGPPAATDIIYGDAGILLALLDDASEVAARAATAAAERLVERAEPTPDGPQWRVEPDQEYVLPGFSHGTAGVAYALAAAGRALHRPDLIEVAVRGAGTLLAIGHHPDGWAVPLSIPPRPDRPAVNFGWCHGPAGTARLFLLLDEIVPDPRWRTAVDACVQALRDSRLPARLYPGYWDNVARCCGTAGVGQFLLDRYQATGDPSLLDWAETLVADVTARTVSTPAGPAWSNHEHTATPPDLPPDPGYMQGAAGIAGWLSRHEAIRAGRPTPPTWPIV